MNKILLYIRWGFFYIISLLPLKILYILSDVAAIFLQYVLRYRNTTIFINLSRSFPDLKYDELKGIAREYYRYMCDILFESIWTISASKRRLIDIVHFENKDILRDIAEKNNTILFVMGHSGNWELLGSVFGDRGEGDCYAGRKCIIAYKHAHTGFTDLLMKKIRLDNFRKFNNDGGVVESKKIMRHIIGNRNEPINYVLIADQNPSGKEKIVLNFLNQPTAMLGGPEFIASKLNIPVVFFHMYRFERGKYRVRFTILSENPSELEHGELTARYAKELENAINCNKYNWLWTHKRWKRDVNAEI